MLCVLIHQDKRLVPGAGATEIELAKHLTSYGEVGSIDCTLLPGSLMEERNMTLFWRDSPALVWSSMPSRSLLTPLRRCHARLLRTLV